MLSFKFPRAHVREMSFDRGRRGHHRTHEMRAATASLPPLEVAITRRRTALTGLQNIGVHPQAHRASSFTPLKTRVVKNPIKPFAFCRSLYLLRTRHNHCAH